MEDIVPFRIQIASIVATLSLLIFVGRMIVRSRLREEYAILWALVAAIMILFAFWRDGLRMLADVFGVFYPPSLVFMAAIFAIAIFLLHLSLVVSRLQDQNRILAQEVALLKMKLQSNGHV